MATSDEVTISMGEVVMVKAAEDEGDASDPNKTQVILQLQPITARDETGETEAAVMAVEAHPVDGEEVEIGYPITCGDSKAVLLVKKFVCPGINVKCVKYEDELISPKQFVYLSGKATLKDWKRAIRIGGVMLRKMMDSGQLDFYQHTTLCTNTCRSTKFDLLINNTRFPPDGSGLTIPSSQVPGVPGEAGQTGEDRLEGLGGKVDWNSTGLESTEQKDNGEISEDTLNFWKGIADVGLMGEVVTNITTELLELLNGVGLCKDQTTVQDADSCLVEVAVLSNLAQVFGLLDLVKKILERRRQETDPSQEQALCTLTSLEQQLEDLKNQQQVRALFSSPQPAKSKAAAKRQSKRPRLQRPASTTMLYSAPVGQQGALQPQQFTVLSPISLSAVGQPFTMASLGQSSNTLTFLPAGSQIFTRYMVAGDGKTDTVTLHPSSGLTLVGAAHAQAAVQDSSQLGAVVSPMELVQLAQQAGSAEDEVEGTVLVQGMADGGQEHTVIEINPAPSEQQPLGVMELQVQGGLEMSVEGQEPQTEAVQGLHLASSGQLTGLQIVVIGENAQGVGQVK